PDTTPTRSLHAALPISVAAFQATGKDVGIEARPQLFRASDRHRAIRREVLPAVGQRAEYVSAARGVANKRAGLKQVRAAAAAIGDRKSTRLNSSHQIIS